MKKIAVIGDVHGCYDELMEMMDNHILPIIDQLEHVVFVGDYIDRGPKSKEVFRYCLDVPKVVMIKGNHEDMMAQEIVDNRYAYWVMNGGGATKISYNHDVNEMVNDAMIMRDLPVYFEFGRVVVAHAGIDPHYPLDDQSETDMIWSRDWVGYDGDYEDNLFCIYGHTPLKNILKKKNQIGIDTGCVFGNTLSAVVVDEDGNWIDKFSVQSRKETPV